MGFTVGDALDDIAIKLQRHPRYTLAMRLDGLNRGLEQLLLFTADQDNYDVERILNPPDAEDPTKYALEWPLPDRCLYVASVTFDGKPLELVSQQQYVNAMSRGGLNPDYKNDPVYYYIRADRYLNVWPRPGRQATVEVYGVIKPEDYEDGDQALDISLNRAYAPALTSYACWWCLQGQPGETERIGQFMGDYLRERAEAKVNMGKNSNLTISRWR